MFKKITKKNLKQHWTKLISVVFVILLLVSYTNILARTNKYTPGETLDPTCPPGEVNCTVDIGTGGTMIYPGSGIAVSNGSGWGTSLTDNSSNWNTAYTNRITSLTTTGTSGAATLSSNTLNIPNYTFAGLGGGSWGTLAYPTYVSGTPFVKMTALGTFALDTNTYLTPTGSAALLTSFPTFNQDTTGTSGNIAGGLGGQILYQSALDTTSKLANGTAGQVLTSNGTILSPSWTSVASSPISIVNSSNLFSTGLTGTGSGVTTATSSNFFGVDAGNSAISASNSNFLGYQVGYYATNAHNSNFLGTSTGSYATSASQSNFLGSQAGFFATNASNSTFIGQQAGYQDTVNNTYNGLSSILLGSFTNTGGYSNSILLGSGISGSPISNTKVNQFMLAPTITDLQLRGVDYSLPSSQGVSSSVLTNDGAGNLTWEQGGGGGSSPITIVNGTNLFSTELDRTGQGVVSSSYSNFLGNYAGYKAYSASNSNFFGKQAGHSATSANNSNFLGEEAGRSATSANNSNFLGQYAGYGAIDASYSNFLGLNAGYQATDASSSNFFGVNSGYNATYATNSNFFGDGAGSDAIESDNSNFFGYQAGLSASSAYSSNFMGNNAGSNATNAYYSTFLGPYAGYYAANASSSIFLGANAGYEDQVDNTNNEDDYSILIGPNTSTSGFSNSIAIGGSAINTATNQLSFGSATRPIEKLYIAGLDYNLPTYYGSSTTTVLTNDGAGNLTWGAGGGGSSPITIVNSSSLFSTGLTGSGSGVTASNSIFLGTNAGYNAIDASSSNFFGLNSGYEATYANNSNFFGSGAGNGATNSDNSNFFGYRTGQDSPNAWNSNFFGFNAGYGATNANNSTFIGPYSGYQAVNATNSIFIGQNAGNNDTVNNTVSGSSILIGSNTSTGGKSNSIALGNGAINTETNQLSIGSPTSPIEKLYIAGLNYNLPTTQGVLGSVLTNDGNGGLTWSAGGGGGGGGSSQWTTIGNDIFNNNIASVGIGTSTPNQTKKLNVSGGAVFEGSGTISSLSTLGSTSSQLDTPTSVVVSGQYAFVLNRGNTPSLAFFDISNPNNISYVSSTSSNISGGINQLLPPGDMALSSNPLDHHLYLVNSSDNSLVSFDISNPNNIPSPLITNDSSLDGPFSIAVSDSYIYVGNMASLSMFNKSDLTFVSSTSTGIAGPMSITIAGGYVYVANIFSSSVDIYNKDTLAHINTINEDQDLMPTKVVIQGNYAYVTNASQSGNNTFAIFDVTDPMNITAKDTITTPYAQMGGVVVSGNYAYVADEQFSLYLFDISNPDNIVQLDSVDNNNISSISSLFYSNGYVYATDYSTDTLNIFGITTAPGGNTLDVSGGVAIGGYSLLNSAPSNGLIVSGNVGIGTATPTSQLEIKVHPSETSYTLSYNDYDGNGLDDATFSGSYIGGIPNWIYVSIDSTAGLKDTFSYNDDNGDCPQVNATEITGSAQEICDGISVTFGSTTGHNQSENWQYAITNFGSPNNPVFKITDDNYNYFTINAVVPSSNFIGDDAGIGALNARDSSFFGDSAGYQATNASNSNFFGASAGSSATNASDSNFLGSYAGNYATNASDSNFFGDSAGYQATNAKNSNFLGRSAGSAATNASNSIFIGQQAGYNDLVNNTGNGDNYSILIGPYTSTGNDGNGVGFSNSIALGSYATNTDVNQFMIGSTTRPINTTIWNTAGGTTCTLISTGLTCSSDENLKTNIVDLATSTLDKLIKIRTVNFNWKDGDTTTNNIGFIAQDLKQYFPELVSVDVNGNGSVNYANMTPILTESIRELDLKVKGIEDVLSLSNFTLMKDFFGTAIVDFVNGILHLKDVAIDTLRIGSPDKRTGVTFYDQATGDPYCLSIVNGVQKTTKGECKVVSRLLGAYTAALESVDENNYTEDSWATYQDVVNTNIMTDDNTEEEVAIATEAIKNAQEDLVEILSTPEPATPEPIKSGSTTPTPGTWQALSCSTEPGTIATVLTSTCTPGPNQEKCSGDAPTKPCDAVPEQSPASIPGTWQALSCSTEPGTIATVLTSTCTPGPNKEDCSGEAPTLSCPEVLSTPPSESAPNEAP